MQNPASERPRRGDPGKAKAKLGSDHPGEPRRRIERMTTRRAKIEVPETDQPVLTALVEAENDCRDEVILWTLHYARARDKARNRKGKIRDSDKWDAFSRLKTGDKEADSQVFDISTLLSNAVKAAYGRRFFSGFTLDYLTDARKKRLIERATMLIKTLETAYGDSATADKWAKVIGSLKVLGGLQSNLTSQSHEMADQLLLYEEAMQARLEDYEGGQGQSLRKPQIHQFPSRQPGYEQPSRKDKVGIKALVHEQLRTRFRATAKQANLTAEELLEYLVVSAVHRAASDATFRKELAEEGDRVAETKQLAKEAAVAVKETVTQRRNAERPVSKRLGRKLTPSR